MSFLLDTNVVSEWVKPQPDPRVADWLVRADEESVFLSVITFGEIRQGIELLAPGRRRDQLSAWLQDELPSRFGGRILPLDREIAEAWGVVMARGRKAGASLSTMDAFIAATAAVHGLALVTRDVRDFAAVGIALVNPWEEPGELA